jgi:hypothetical protein
VVVGEKGAVAQLTALLKEERHLYEELPLNQPAYHTPMFEEPVGCWKTTSGRPHSPCEVYCARLRAPIRESRRVYGS